MDDKFQTGVDVTYVAHTRFLWQEADKSPSYQPARTRNGGEGDSQQVLQLAAKRENCLLAIFCTKCGWSTLWRHGKMHRQKKPTQDSRWEERRNYPSEVVPSRSEKRQIVFFGLPQNKMVLIWAECHPTWIIPTQSVTAVATSSLVNLTSPSSSSAFMSSGSPASRRTGLDTKILTWKAGNVSPT